MVWKKIEQIRAAGVLRSRTKLLKELDAAWNAFVDAKFEKSIACIDSALDILDDKKTKHAKKRINTANTDDYPEKSEKVGKEKDDQEQTESNTHPESLKQEMKQVDNHLRELKKQEKQVKQSRLSIERLRKITSKKEITIKDTIEILGIFGIDKSQSNNLKSIFSGKILIFQAHAFSGGKKTKKNRRIEIASFNCRDGIAYFMFKGLEHINPLGRDGTKGWIPFNPKNTDNFIKIIASKSIDAKNIKPDSPEHIVQTIENMHTQGLKSQEITAKIKREHLTIKSKDITRKHADIKVDDYVEHNGTHLVHLTGFPHSLFVVLDTADIKKAAEITPQIAALPDVLDHIDHPWNDHDAKDLLKEAHPDNIKAFDIPGHYLHKDHIQAMKILKALYDKNKVIIITPSTAKQDDINKTKNPPANTTNYTTDAA